MNITATGSSSLTALYLQKLLGNTSSASDQEDDATTSDLLSISSAGRNASTQASDPFKADLDKLESAISSGDLASAKSAYAAMAEQMQKHGDVPSDFKAIGDALDGGDLTGATTALSTVKTNMAAMAPPPPPSGGSNPLKNDLDQLSTLLSSGDASSAKSLFDTILQKAQGLSSDDTASATDALTTALAAGDTTTASTALAELLARLQQGQSTSARSMESVAAAAYLSVSTS
ncbi:MAG TPA: hypothetical protein VK188_16250 [Holophaga sp.]|nr:hypothetical protein [Holophaga sp.]